MIRAMTTGGTAVADYDHFLLTRFNVRHWGVPASDEWVRHRMAFFKDMCLSSVASQTEKNFQWLVFFDANREQWLQDEVDQLSPGLFTPVWVDGDFDPEFIGNELVKRSEAPWFITTRMDNDDAVARDFIERIQREFEKQDFEFINFGSGLQLTEAGAVFGWSDPCGPFISLIEKRGDDLPRTVFIEGHDKLGNHGPIRQVTTHPMWAQMVHAKNMANTVKGVRVGPSVIAAHFDINREAAPVSQVSLRIAQVRNTAGLAKLVLSDPRRIRKAARILREKIAR